MGLATSFGGAKSSPASTMSSLVWTWTSCYANFPAIWLSLAPQGFSPSQELHLLEQRLRQQQPQVDPVFSSSVVSPHAEAGMVSSSGRKCLPRTSMRYEESTSPPGDLQVRSLRAPVLVSIGCGLNRSLRGILRRRLRHNGKNHCRRPRLVVVDDVGCFDHVRSMRLILTGIQVSIKSREVAAGNLEPQFVS